MKLSRRFFCLAVIILLLTQNDSYGQNSRKYIRQSVFLLIQGNHKDSLPNIIASQSNNGFFSSLELFLLHIYTGQFSHALDIFLANSSTIISELENPVKDSTAHFLPLLSKAIMENQAAIEQELATSALTMESKLFIKIAYCFANNRVLDKTDTEDYSIQVKEYLEQYPNGRFRRLVDQYFVSKSKSQSGIYGYSTSISLAGIIPINSYADNFITKTALQFDFDYFFYNFLFGVSATNYYTSLLRDVVLFDTTLWKKSSNVNHVSFTLNGGYRRIFSERMMAFFRAGLMLGWLFPTSSDVKIQNLPTDFLVKSTGGKLTIGMSYTIRQRDVYTITPGYKNRLKYGFQLQYSLSLEKFDQLQVQPVWINSFSLGINIGAFNL